MWTWFTRRLHRQQVTTVQWELSDSRPWLLTSRWCYCHVSRVTISVVCLQPAVLSQSNVRLHVLWTFSITWDCKPHPLFDFFDYFSWHKLSLSLSSTQSQVLLSWTLKTRFPVIWNKRKPEKTHLSRRWQEKIVTHPAKTHFELEPPFHNRPWQQSSQSSRTSSGHQNWVLTADVLLLLATSDCSSYFF